MLDSLHRRPRGRKLAPLLSALTGGRVAPVPRRPSDEELWFHEHFWEAAEQVLDFVDLEGKAVADIGSGDGIIDLALTLRGRPRELVGYDVNLTPVDHLLDVARRYAEVSELPPGLSFRRSEPERLDAADAAFDVVVTWSVFEHARDPLGLLREMRRIVRPDGVLFLQLWPFYHSHRGSHLWDWFPEPFHHLGQSVEEIEAAVRASDRHGSEWAEYMLAEYKTLNRITLDELGDAVRGAGFSVRELELIGQRSRVPSGLDEFPLSALGVAGVKLLAVPV
jgi:2-polyprenyl-3-methyl-5-hydroxy-6-metoxy-1,4-benzoquinol methylase